MVNSPDTCTSFRHLGVIVLLPPTSSQVHNIAAGSSKTGLCQQPDVTVFHDGGSKGRDQTVDTCYIYRSTPTRTAIGKYLVVFSPNSSIIPLHHQLDFKTTSVNPLNKKDKSIKMPLFSSRKSEEEVIHEPVQEKKHGLFGSKHRSPSPSSTAHTRTSTSSNSRHSGMYHGTE